MQAGSKLLRLHVPILLEEIEQQSCTVKKLAGKLTLTLALALALALALTLTPALSLSLSLSLSLALIPAPNPQPGMNKHSHMSPFDLLLGVALSAQPEDGTPLIHPYVPSRTHAFSTHPSHTPFAHFRSTYP